MNYKRKAQSKRKLRRVTGYNALGKDTIRKQINRDYFDMAQEILNQCDFLYKFKNIK